MLATGWSLSVPSHYALASVWSTVYSLCIPYVYTLCIPYVDTLLTTVQPTIGYTLLADCTAPIATLS